jgi:hypothetical protein
MKLETVIVYREDVPEGAKINKSDLAFWEKSGWSTDKQEATIDKAKAAKKTTRPKAAIGASAINGPEVTAEENE